MPRPKKCRRVCRMPEAGGFIPLRQTNNSDADSVVITVDEYETIRLIDFARMSQEQCAAQMEVARTTITGIYDAARYKIADALINEKKLVIEGGHFCICQHNEECCGHGCHQQCFTDGNEHCHSKCQKKLIKIKGA